MSLVSIKIHAGDKGWQESVCSSGEKSQQTSECEAASFPEAEVVETVMFQDEQEGQPADHGRNHMGEKSFRCPECHKSFTRKEGLHDHIRIHTGEKPHQCEVCQKSFTKTCNLMRHVKIHMGKKPFQCSQCPKAFSQKSHLGMHKRHHTGEKPFQCPECQKTFTVRGNLTKHMIVHTGEKPFQCLECQKSFTQKSGLKVHMRTHTEEKVLECSLCPMLIPYSTLLEHMTAHHARGLSSQTRQTQNTSAHSQSGMKVSDKQSDSHNTVLEMIDCSEEGMYADTEDPDIICKEEDPLALYTDLGLDVNLPESGDKVPEFAAQTTEGKVKVEKAVEDFDSEIPQHDIQLKTVM